MPVVKGFKTAVVEMCNQMNLVGYIRWSALPSPGRMTLECLVQGPVTKLRDIASMLRSHAHEMCGDASVVISEEERVGPFPTFSSFEMGSTPKKVLTLWTSRADGKTDGGGGGFESHEKLDISDGKIDILTAETTTSPILFPSDVSSQADHDRASGSARSSDLQRQIDELRAEVRASREEILLAIQNGYREDPAVRAESEGLRGDDENNG
jgi:hypothetical protein